MPKSFKLIITFIILLFLCMPSYSKDFVVTNAADTTDEGTLRWAVKSAIENPGSDKILFEIFDSQIILNSNLPEIKGVNADGTIIDGAYQYISIKRASGYWYDVVFEINASNCSISNLSISGGGRAIVLSGDQAENNNIEGCKIENTPVGIMILKGAVLNTIKKNSINNTLYAGIYVTDPYTSQNIITNNNIADINDSNRGNGIILSYCSFNTIIKSNYINNNFQNGILLKNSSNNVISKNFIGTDKTKSLDLGNGECGILISMGSSNNNIGTRDEDAGNIIAFNGKNGIFAGLEVKGEESKRNDIVMNSFYKNTGKGIKLFEGANEGIKPPMITNLTTDEIEGRGAPPFGIIDVYVISSTGDNEGKTHVGTGYADENGYFKFKISKLNENDVVTITATTTR